MDPTTNLLLTALAAAGSQMLQHSTLLRSTLSSFRNNSRDNPLNRYSVCYPTNRTVYNYMVESLNGTYTDLNSYRGRVLLIVNVASYSVYTNQYLDFNDLINSYGSTRTAILAFPCNQFRHSEPGTNRELLNALKYVRPGSGWTPHPDLTIFGKIDVNGDGQHPIYKFLEGQCPQTVKELPNRDDIEYSQMKITDVTGNFEKFLIDKRGRPRYRFHPTAWLGGKVIRKYIDQLLAES